MFKSQKGFTLIETLITVVILAILVGILWDVLSPWDKNAEINLRVSESQRTAVGTIIYHGMSGDTFAISIHESPPETPYNYPASSKRIFFRTKYFDILEVNSERIRLKLSANQSE